MIGSVDSLAGQVALVTGGASGIGRQTVHVLSALGADTYSIDKSFGPGTDHEVHCDLADITEIRMAVDGICQKAGRLDILVNCAGIVGPKCSVTELTEDSWDLVQAVNLKAVVFTAQAATPYLTANGRRGARIVNVSSAAAHRTSSHSVSYASSKAAIEAVTRILAGELADFEVNVNAVAPGVTATAIFHDDSDEDRARRAASGPSANLFKRFAQPDDIAQVIAFLCLPESRQITGQVVHASAGSIV